MVFLGRRINKDLNSFQKRISAQKNVFVMISPFWVLEQKFVVLIIGVLPIILSNVLFQREQDVLLVVRFVLHKTLFGLRRVLTKL